MSWKDKWLLPKLGPKIIKYTGKIQNPSILSYTYNKFSARTDSSSYLEYNTLMAGTKVSKTTQGGNYAEQSELRKGQDSTYPHYISIRMLLVCMMALVKHKQLYHFHL